MHALLLTVKKILLLGVEIYQYIYCCPVEDKTKIVFYIRVSQKASFINDSNRGE